MASKISALSTTAALFSVLLVQLVASASEILDTRQIANPNGPPPGWTPVGCFTDNATTRTLMAQSLVNATTMTPAVCLNFCSQFNPSYGFAGVEFGQQCWCDGVIQLTANATDDSECDIPCGGDETLLCGGTSRIMVFTDGSPGPKLPTIAINPTGDGVALWQYVGCYSDNPGTGLGRTLHHLAAGAMDVNSCGPVACESAFPASAIEILEPGGATEQTNLFAGSEFGGECWCGPAIASTAQLLPDIACSAMGCLGMNDLACGGALVMAIYQFNPLVSPNNSLNCEFVPEMAFSINAVFVDDIRTSVPITMVSLQEADTGDPLTAPNNISQAGILSFCPTCSNVTFMFENETDSLAVITTPETAINDLTVLHPAGTVNFLEITNTDILFLGFCISESILHPQQNQLTTSLLHTTLPVTAPPDTVLNEFIAWSLCSNITAGGRMDVVYKILTFQAGYNLTNCRDVVLELDFSIGT